MVALLKVKTIAGFANRGLIFSLVITSHALQS